MKQLSVTLLGLAVAGVLSACGGSSDGGATMQTTPSTPSMQNNNNTSRTPGNTSNTGNTGSTGNASGSTGSTSNTGTGSINNNIANTITIAGNRAITISRSRDLSNNSYDTLTVGNKSYTISHPNITSGTFNDYDQPREEIISSGNHVSYQRYGMVHDKTTKEYHLYSMGNKTPVAAVPATGTATYEGRAVYVDFTDNDDSTDGISRFNVNFGTKTIIGTITDDDIAGGKVDLRATISENTFIGSHNGTETSGAFYGSAAQELGGTFVNNAQQFGGAYGAVKK